MHIQRSPFGVLPDGRAIELYELSNARGLEASVITLGATLVSLRARAGSGSAAPLVLELEPPARHLVRRTFFGATIGRVANRIAHGRFRLDGVEHALACNDGAHHLHGGRAGFDRAVWFARELHEPDAVGVSFRHRSPDGDGGYPGALELEVAYRVTARDDLGVEYRAHSDRRTVVNLTHHSYWNLRNGGAGTILEHELEIDAEAYTPVDRAGIPSGEIRPVEGTPFDFRRPRALAARLGELGDGRGGYDHNFVLSPRRAEPTFAARLRDPASGRVLEVLTTQPGLQLYSGNFFDGTLRGPEGRVYRRWHGLSLEPQHFPDAPNHTCFPSIVLEPGATYQHAVVYRFHAGA